MLSFQELAFGASSADELDDDTMPPPVGLEKESSMADLISYTAVQGREQRRWVTLFHPNLVLTMMETLFLILLSILP